jgi:hypothetical protein
MPIRQLWFAGMAVLIAAMFCVAPRPGFAPHVLAEPDPAAATLSVGANTVTIIANGIAHTASGTETLHAGDEVRTDAAGGGTITFFDGSHVTLETGTALAIQALGQAPEGGGIAELLTEVGETISSVVPQLNGARYQMAAPNSYGVVRGTVFHVRVVKGAGGGVLEEDYATDEGEVEVHAGNRIFSVGVGQQIRLTPTSGGQGNTAVADTPVDEYGQGAGVQRARSLPRTGDGPGDDGQLPLATGAGGAALAAVLTALYVARRRRLAGPRR